MITRLWQLGLFCFFIPVVFSCQQRQKQAPVQTPDKAAKMQVKILDKIRFSNIPSASGIEIINGKVYVIGDDSPYLYVLDLPSFKLTDTIALFATSNFNTGRIPKAIKPDLECLTTLTINGQEHLLALGSGSAPNRQKGYLIKLPEVTGDPAVVQEFSLAPLYQALQQNKELLLGDLLNLEAAATTSAGDLFLWQRSAVTGPNVVFRFNAANFLQSLVKPTNQIPAYTLTQFDLPEIKGLSARFSGAVAYKNTLFFTAAVENTPDAIQDGEVLGSFVGYVPAAAMEPDATPQTLYTALIQEVNGATYQGKIESIVIESAENSHTFRALAITDNDNGESELLTLQITL